MSYRGRIKDGAVVLDEPIDLPEGTEVQILCARPPLAKCDEERPKGPTLYERLKPIIGSVDDWPSDMSVNLDHYLYGHPKQQP
jgi:hypothetical protein